MDLRELYQDVIIDHNKNPRNFGRPETCDHAANGDNPLCGDTVTVYVTVADNVIKNVQFNARGCAISIASASMMTELVKDKPLTEARAIFKDFHEIVTSKKNAGPDDLERLNNLAALTGVREFPMRVKCAMLPWHTMVAALDQSEDDVTTE
jgi:nitrogen fixation NifU-like protein